MLFRSARILAGYERPHEGTVTLRGAPIPARGWHPVQLVMQHPEKAVNPRWTMRRILNEGWTPGAELLEALGVRQAWMDRRPAELSGGELQRFCVARALGPGTRMLVADEMTAMLDAITQAQIWQVALREAKERRIGMLVISHERALIRRICDRIVDFERLVGRSGIGPPRDGDAVIN